MLMILIMLASISVPSGDAIFRTCVPNTQFLLNGRLCYCNNLGRWSEATCQMIGRRQTCQPGQIIWEECSQCICQENGKLLCTNTECSEDGVRKNSSTQDVGAELWCTPFRSYYINCSLCVCPASGKMSEARCATDSSCSLKGPNLSLDVITKSVCIPKVMYLFACLHCLCSDDGFFVQNKCVETCHKVPESTRRCIPRSFYRVDCNVYRCPENGVPDSNLRSKSSCNEQTDLLNPLSTLRNVTHSCAPNKYTSPKCIYCECNSQGVVNENSCLEQECLKIDDYNYDNVKSTCSPGELVPTCMECFCPKSGFTEEKYCTRVCSYQNKLIMLERVLEDKHTLIDLNSIKEIMPLSETCEPNTVFLDRGRYCLCPENGNTNFKLCTSVVDDSGPQKTHRVLVDKANLIDYNITCEPNTFVEFGCNTCYCIKNGKIDQKWCTFDDCEAKQVIQEAHKGRIALPTEPSAICVPGSISKVDCNFCICGSSGLIKDRACTNNTCSGTYKPMGNEFACEPSAYYAVDCNICFCSTDGVKNLDKCTKNQCESNFLRSDSCTPGELFSDDCNICVCPPNGDKKDKACTNRTCYESDTPWKKIFKISQNLIGNQVVEDTTKNADLCFPGEEFENDCKVCVCPEMGLREYASCTPMHCNDKQKNLLESQSETRGEYSDESVDEDSIPDDDERIRADLIGTDRVVENQDVAHVRTRREENCMVYNITDSSEREQCTPGSEYIIRCRICICPYMGNINHFCRPMPEGQYCEQAFPNYNFVPMGRRNAGNNDFNATMKAKYPIEVKNPHNHTEHKCEQLGMISDECFICECVKDKVIVEEHCFQSSADVCVNAKPTFLYNNNSTSFIKKLLSFVI